MDTFEKTKSPAKRLADTPAIRGPFRGLIITFVNSDYNEFREIYPLLTFEHPNFYFCKSDKRKCIIYYKYPYDVATLISKFHNSTELHFSIYYDELTKTLQPDVLYVVTRDINKLLAKVEQLNGQIIYKTKIGFQIQFEDFKMTAIAHEELRREFSVKFAYKSEVNKYSNPVKITKQDEEKHQLKSDIKLLIQKYKGKAKTQECEQELNEIRRKQSGFNRERVQKAAENLEFANISWSAAYDSTDDGNTEEREPENVFDELERLYKNL